MLIDQVSGFMAIAGIMRATLRAQLIRKGGIIPAGLPDTGRIEALRLRAVTLFNERSYFESHEVFEELWLASEGDVKSLYQGLVQVCAGLLKHARGQNDPARTLLGKALARLDAAPESCWPELGAGDLARRIREIVAALERGEAFDTPLL